MNSILIKAPNWIGDCVMATPAIALLRRAFPAARIDALARPSVAGIFATSPDLSSTIAADDRDMPPEVAKAVRDARYNAVALMPNSLGAAWSVWRLGITRRIGYARAGRSLLLTTALPYDPLEWRTAAPRPISRKSTRATPGVAVAPRHMVDYYLRIAEATARALGVDPVADPDAGRPALVLPSSAAAEARVDALLAEHGLEGRLLVGINPGAVAGGAKRWPAARLAEAADRLAAAHGAAIVCTSIRNEAPLADAVQRLMTQPLHRLGEEVDLQGMVALLGRLGVFITNDSGGMHIAAARGTPIVGVFGPTDWNVTYPWCDAHEIVRASPDCAPCLLRECPIDHRCMTAVGVGAVVASAERLLGLTAGTEPA